MALARTQVIMDWITSLGWDASYETGYPLLPGPEIVDMPDKAVFITGTGGPGFVVEEGLPQAATFQARTRGPADNPLAPEAAAEALDLLILNAPFPVSIDGVWINKASRLGGPPTPLPLSPASRRFEYTCNYTIVIGA